MTFLRLNWKLSALVMVLTFALGASFMPSSIHTSLKVSHSKPSLRQQPPLLVQIHDQENSSNGIKLGLLSVNSVASILLPVAMTWAIAFPALAASAGSGFDSKLFTNDYEDPLHPLCRRQIQVSLDGNTFHYSGSSVGPKDDPVLRGCSPKLVKEFGGLKKESFDGTIAANKISAGDSTLQGVWEPAGSAELEFGDVDGIRWNDGNKWIVKKKTVAVQVGEFITFAYIGVSILAGFNGVYKMYQKKTSEASN